MSVESSKLDVGISAPRGAVFLSYASQDAEAAKRICDALRGAGVEVWFDQSELVGGDAWDQKIRKQIKECALLIPIISANTQARTEGYFRLEWRLADQRTHLMAKGRPFLLPVVIDDTHDADAHVPDSFTEVQWTKAPGGVVPAAFVERTKRLLTGEASALPRAVGSSTGPSEAPAGPSRFGRIALIGVAVAGLGLAAYLSLRPAKTPAPAASATRTASGETLQRVEAILGKPDVTRVELDLAGQLLAQAAQAEPTNALVFAAWARVDCRYFTENYDWSEARQDAARKHVAQAVALAPDRFEVRLARAVSMKELADKAGSAEVLRIWQGLAKERPTDVDVLHSLVWCHFNAGDPATALATLDRIESLGGTNARTMFNRGLIHLLKRRFGEAMPLFEGATEREPAVKYLLWRSYLETIWLGRPDLARRTLAQIPADYFFEDMPASAKYFVECRARDFEAALASIRAIPRDYVQSSAGAFPTGYLRGRALKFLGRTAAAEAEWTGALAAVERRLAANPNDRDLLQSQAVLLAALGRNDAAAKVWTTVTQLYGPSHGSWLTMYYAFERSSRDELLEVLARGRTDFMWMTAAELRIDPMFDQVRDDPRFAALLKEAEADPQRAPQPLKAASPDPKSIAVLPFTNMSEDQDGNAFFADGIHEDILTDLAGIRELRVVSRTSVMDYRGTTKKIPQIGRELNVAYVLEGSVRRAGNKVRVTGQLIRTATDEHVWAKSFDRDLTDIFQIQTELAKAIASELNAAISPQEQQQLAARPTENLAAYDLYLKSREIANRGAASTREELQKRERLLQSAVELDPKFLDAWCELVQAHVGLIAASVDTTPARLAKATAALERARELAPEAPEVARATGAYQLFGMHDPANALAQFTQLVDRYPNDTDNLSWLAVAQMLGGRWAESLVTQRRLTRLDPANRGAGMGYAFNLRYVRRYDEALAEVRRMMVLRPDDFGLHVTMGYFSYMADGSTLLLEETLKRAEAINANSPTVVELRQAKAFHDRDYQEYLRLDKLLPNRTGRGSFDAGVATALEAAAVHRALGDTAGARDRLGSLPVRLRAQLELEPNNTQHLRALASAESILGNHAEALRLIDRAAAMLPESKETRIGMNISVVRARILAWAGDKDQAIAEITRLLKVPSELNVHMMKYSVEWLPLAKDPRFQALLEDPRNNAPLY